jgi:large subunit ribosomal protein L23
MVTPFPLATEKSVRLIDTENTLIFVVDKRRTKAQVKEELERLLGAKIASVNTQNDPKGSKRAYVRFGPETSAIDIATKLGLM